MIGDYRFRIPGTDNGGGDPEITANGIVKFDVFVETQVEENPDTWQLIDGGHFTQPVPGQVLENAASANDALSRIGEMIADRGLAQSDRARRALMALLPNGIWPANDVSRTLVGSRSGPRRNERD